MAYEDSFNKTMTLEGGYSNSSTDTGGETYKGIARNKNPNWVGWVIVDEAKKSTKFPANLDENKDLQKFIKEWYKINYWDPFNLDSMSDVLSDKIFDQAVNLGTGRVTKFIQQVCNALNLNDRFGSDIVEDGLIGPATRKRLRDADVFCARYSTPVIAKALECLQGSFYVDLANGSNKKIQRNNFAGWINARIGTIENHAAN